LLGRRPNHFRAERENTGAQLTLRKAIPHVFVASPEDVIIKKLEFFREGGSQKHLIEIKGILAQTPVDSSYLEDWISRLGLTQSWSAALQV
jgi:hypothetical protein